MSLSFIKQPTEVLRQWLIRDGFMRGGGSEHLFKMGQLAMALEVITVLKTLEEIPITSDLGRAETESVLVTLLRDTGFDLDEVNELYDRLSAWRQPKFHRASVQPYDEHVHIELSSSEDFRFPHLARPAIDVPSSVVEALGGVEALEGLIDVQLRVHQSLHGDATDGSEESRDGGAESTPSG